MATRVFSWIQKYDVDISPGGQIFLAEYPLTLVDAFCYVDSEKEGARIGMQGTARDMSRRSTIHFAIRVSA
jgi:hypothetical protein